ncbi:MAG: hypothetical protein LJE95_04365 [Acidobacteria bacterium]|jgi:hypothetical protein|nr:hypothetical protein [Acidobacteriota bacterium]
MSTDQEQLQLLSIFHYVVGGLMALVACIPFIHFFIGLALTAGWFEKPEPDVAPIGIVLMLIAGLFIVCGWTLAVLMIVAGRFLAKRQHRTFCIVVAAMACLFMPFGTILGVFTIVVLMRESVQALFEGGKQAAPPPAPAEG